MRATDLKKYNNLLTLGRWSNKDPKDDQILALVGVAQKIADEYKKPPEKSNTPNRESTKGELAYIRDLPPWMPEDPKGGVGNKTKDGKLYWWCKEHRAGKGRWVHHKPEDHGKRTSTSSSRRGTTKSPSKGDRNKNMTLTKDLKAGLMAIKDQSDVQSFLSQFNINARGNE